MAMIVILVCLVLGLIYLLIKQLYRVHQSRENLRLTLSSTTDIVVLLDSKARYVEIFANSEERLITDRDSIIGKTVRSVLGDQIGDQVEKLVEEVLESGEKRSISYSLNIKGENLWFEATLARRDHETVVAMIRDMTIQKSLTQQLEDQRLFMEKIFNTVPDPIFLKDEQHRWLYGNDAFCAALGKSRSEFYGKCDTDFFPPAISEAFFESDRETFSRMVEIEIEERLPSTNVVTESGMIIGDERTILTKKAAFIARDGKKTLVGIIRDITDRKMMEKQLEEQRARQISASRMASLGEMAGGVAHEINNPLAIISGYASRLTDVLNQEPIPKARALEIAKRIDTTAIRIATIVKGLRAISRDGGYDAKEVVAVETIVTDTLGLCTERFLSQGVTVETKLEPDLVIQCRPVQIAQVILNLLTNAFHAVSKTPGGSIVVEAAKVGDDVEIAVIDSGEGVPPAHREKIFEPFFTTKAVGAGTGLGLSIGSSIVREHGGELTLDSTSPQTRFVIHLPQV